MRKTFCGRLNFLSCAPNRDEKLRWLSPSAPHLCWSSPPLSHANRPLLMIRHESSAFRTGSTADAESAVKGETDTELRPGHTLPSFTNYPLGILSSRGGNFREEPGVDRTPYLTLIITHMITDVKDFASPCAELSRPLTLAA